MTSFIRQALRGSLAACLLLNCGSRSDLNAGNERPGVIAIAEPSELPNPPQALAPPPVNFQTNIPPTISPSPEPGCVRLSKFYNSQPASILLLIDQSGSMNWLLGSRSRWDVLRDAIVDADDGLLTLLDPDTQVGLLFYTSLDGFQNGGTCPMLTGNSILQSSSNNFDDLRRLYSTTEPLVQGDTPSADALNAAANILKRTPQTGPRYIVLLTDGVPDTCAQPDPQRGTEQAVDAAAAAFEAGIRVLTVGVSQALQGGPLQWMANAGAGKARELIYGIDEDAEPPLTAASDPVQLAAQLRGALGAVRSCIVDLGTRVDRGQALDGQVMLDGQQLNFNQPNGWSFAAGQTIQIYGRSCDRILGDGQSLEIRYPCSSASDEDTLLQ